MKKVMLMASAVILLLTSGLVAQDSAFELRIVGTALYAYHSQPTEFFVMDAGNDAEGFEQTLWMSVGNDVAIYGFIEMSFPWFFPEPLIFSKADVMEIGDSWSGTLPEVPGTTHEVVVDQRQVTVAAGTFDAFIVELQLEGVVIGHKWLVNGVGMVAWHFEYMGYIMDFDLKSYEIAGGSGYFPLAVGNNWVFDLTTDISTYQAPSASITIDGDRSDWAGILPPIIDEEGDDPSPYSGADIREVYIAHDVNYLYLMTAMWDGPPNVAWGIASDYAYFFHISTTDDPWEFQTVWANHNGVDWQLSGEHVDISSSMIACGGVMEIAIPWDDLGHPSSLSNFFMRIGSGTDNYDATYGLSVVFSTTGIDQVSVDNLPEGFGLAQNYPNPFNPATGIDFSLPRAGDVRLEVYNVIGQRVATLVDGWRPAGEHSAQWDASETASGIYLYRLTMGDLVMTKKMLLLK